VKNTIFNKNEKTNAYPDEWSKMEVNYSIVHNKVLGGTKNIEGDPLFIDAKGNNFHLKQNSPCWETGEDDMNLGAFNAASTALSFSKIKVKSNKEKNTGDWVEMVNNYNIPLDLSLYKIVITTATKKKELTLPKGLKIDGLSHLIIVNDYQLFTNHYKNKEFVIGGLPKMGNK